VRCFEESSQNKKNCVVSDLFVSFGKLMVFEKYENFEKYGDCDVRYSMV
jgi:hypothetical protein